MGVSDCICCSHLATPCLQHNIAKPPPLFIMIKEMFGVAVSLFLKFLTYSIFENPVFSGVGDVFHWGYQECYGVSFCLKANLLVEK